MSETVLVTAGVTGVDRAGGGATGVTGAARRAGTVVVGWAGGMMVGSGAMMVGALARGPSDSPLIRKNRPALTTTSSRAKAV